MNLLQYKSKAAGLLCVIFIVLLPKTSFAKTLNIVVGLERPPYIQQETDSGYELDLLSQVIKLMGHKAEYIYVPYGRTQQLLAEPDIDAITTMTAATESQFNRLTDTYVTYHNSVVSLAESNLSINQISDLKGLGVISFHNAKILLGKEYHDAVMQNADYIEIAEQLTQVKVFLKDRVHCIVIDKHIFNYLINQLGVNKSVVFHNVFPPIDYQMLFKDPKLVLSFNKHLAIFKQSAQYRQLQQKYLSFK